MNTTPKTLYQILKEKYGTDSEIAKAFTVSDGMRAKRNVWTVATRGYKEAHFATFPPALIEPCVLAGCPAGGVVLDPFGGSGTTAGVAIGNGRKAILCELNPAYADLVPTRIESILSAYPVKKGNAA
ncbi:site-specific DNA-methyltransferase [Yersinia bercovieri]|uniref:site-specific DNA-methyltransferase n=1 Tax=Yersinia bercovieri TaxID=634 RepID=UPI0021BD72F7|nr:site-specific DNA-methyltransferase [Yersinia bercovieri]